MKSDDFMRCIMGPFGSGKSSGCVIEIIRRCKEQKIGPDGFRRSRWAVIRNTRPQLKDTTLKTWFDWVPPGIAGRWKESEMVFYLEFGDVKAEILFRPLDTPDDIARVLSLELTGCWLNECREIPKEIVEALQGRLARYPSTVNGGSNWFGMICDTNPPEEDSYWYKIFEHLPVDDDDPESVMPCETWKQPSGLEADADNRENLDPEYYERLARGKTKEWIDVYIRGLYGPSTAGKPVYHRVFKSDRHLSSDPLRIDPYLPIVIGMDFGLTPAAIFKQMQHSGRIYCLREIVEFDMGIDRFIDRRLLPMVKLVFPNNPIIIIGDPAGVRRSDTDESNCFKSLKRAGFKAKPASTNDPKVRIQATETLLASYPEGEPLEIIDRQCKYYIEGLRSKYRYPKQKLSGNFSDKPEKNDWSHITEAGQYCDMFLQSGKFHIADYVRYTDQGIHVLPHYQPADRVAGY